MGATERIKEYLTFKGITKYKFCNDLGFSNKFLDNSNNMGTDKACIILRHYSEINAHWLLTGEGKMLIEKNQDTNNTSPEIPLFNVEEITSLKELLDNNRSFKIVDTIKIPNLPTCDGAISISGDNMYPVLKSGDLILYKKFDIQNIFFGEMYLLSIKLNNTEEYITINYIQKSEKGDEYIKLVSKKSNHEPKDVHTSKVAALAIIKASICKNVMI